MIKKLSQYNLVANEAYKNVVEHQMGLEQAWDEAATKIISSIESRKKGCPRNTFIGLCNSGLLKGITPISTTGNLNSQYAQFAIMEWKLDQNISKVEMWGKVVKHFNKAKSHQGQLDVVLGLTNYLH